MMKTRAYELEKQQASLQVEFFKLREDLKQKILSLPDNPAGTQVGQGMSISSLELFKHDNWTASFHNFKAQYKKICEFIDSLPVEQVIPRLLSILVIGHIDRKDGRFKLHPDVIKSIAAILEE